MDDVLSDILRLIGLRSCVYFVRDFWSPWAMAMDAGPVAQFHAIVRGECVVEFDGTFHHVRAGDVLLFPRGARHVLADSEGRHTVPGAEVLRSLEGDAPFFANGQKPTQLVCGHFEYRGDLRHPLIEQLPALLHIGSFDVLSPGSVDSILPLLVREMKEGRAGGTSVVERLAEVLLIQVLRTHVVRQREPNGFLAGLSDRRLALALRLMHADVGGRLTLETLARAAGMSRSAFALDFKTRLGVAPIEYLTKWRMYTASELIRAEGQSLNQVARRVGYESEISFSRAFKREFSVAPGEYRRRARLDC